MASNFDGESLALKRWESETLMDKKRVTAKDRMRFSAPNNNGNNNNSKNNNNNNSYRYRIMHSLATEGDLAIEEALFRLMKKWQAKKLRMLDATSLEAFRKKLSSEPRQAPVDSNDGSSSSADSSDESDEAAENDAEAEDSDTGALIGRFHSLFGLNVCVLPGNAVYKRTILTFGNRDNGQQTLFIGHVYRRMYVPLGDVIQQEEAEEELSRAQGALVEQVTLAMKQDRQRRASEMSPAQSPSPSPPRTNGLPPTVSAAGDSAPAAAAAAAAPAQPGELDRILDLFEGVQEFDVCEPPTENVNVELKKKLQVDPVKFRLCKIDCHRRGGANKVAVPLLQQADGLKLVKLDKPASWKHDQQVVVEVLSRDDSSEQATGTVLGYYQRSTRYQFMTRARLNECLAGQPDRFKRCILELNAGQGGWAVPVDPADRLSRVELNGRENCGRACQSDEVVVEVMGQDPATKEFRGRVVGVYRQAEKLRHQLFLCEVLPHPGALMRPLCGTFPKIGYDNSVALRTCRDSDLLDEHSTREERGQVQVNQSWQQVERINRDYVSVFTPRKDSTGKIHLDPNRAQRVNKEFCDQVFLVCFEFWHLDKSYPFGKVVYVLESSGSDQLEVFNISQMRHRLPRPLKETADVRKAVRGIAKQAEQPALKGRVDYRAVPTVTIDNPDTRDMDDAISYSRSLKTGEETVGVHITDVCQYLLAGSRLDKLARSRLRTIYPPKSSAGHVSPNHMLPRGLAEEALSLKENAERPCLSVIFRFNRDKRGNLTWKQPEFQQTVVQSDRRLNKADVQPVLLQTDRDDADFGPLAPELVRALRALWAIALRLRLKRLGQAGFQVQNEDDDVDEIGKTFETSCLIEELMVLANLSVGQWLANKGRPVAARVQDKPRPANVQKWLDTYGPVLVHSPRLQRDLAALDCKVSIIEFPLSLCRSDYEFMMQYYRGKTRECVLKLMNDSRHPHMMLALSDWFAISQPAGYEPTQTTPGGENGGPPKQPYHFSLQQVNYVHFTSPMRRYADIVVHRAFRAALQGRNEVTEDLDELCDSLRTVERRAKRFDKDSACLEYSSRLKRQPQQELVAVRAVDESEIAFTNGRLRRMPKTIGALKMGNLGLDARPLMVAKDKFKLKWSRRIFVHPSCENAERYFTRIQRRHGSEVRVRRDTYVQRVQCRPVKQLREKFVKSGGDYGSVRADFQQLQNVLDKDRGTWMVTCETDQSTDQLLVSGNPVQFYREFGVGDIMMVQFRSQLRHGLLTPAVSLVEVCESHAVCVCHKDDPVRCFAEVTDVKSKSSYRDIQEYAEIWQRIVAIESATIASREDDSVTLHQVALTWTYHQPSNRWLGAFHLPEDFYIQRQIKVGSDATVIDDNLDEKQNELADQRGRGGGRSLAEEAVNEAFQRAGERARFSDFLCLRFPGCTPVAAGAHTRVAHGGILLVYHTAHGRCASCCVRRGDGASSYTCQLVVFTLQEHDLPAHFEWSEVTCATVEVLQKFLPIRRQELALWKLPRLPPDSLANKIALLASHARRPEDLSYGQQLRAEGVQSYSIVTGSEQRHNDYTGETWTVQRRIPCNDVQNRAITEAMKYDLTLIWGPPGTGKTSSGVMLTYWYVFVNRCFDKIAKAEEAEEEEADADDGEDDDGDEVIQEDDGVEKAQINYADFEPTAEDPPKDSSADGWGDVDEAIRRSLDGSGDHQAADESSWNTVGRKGRVTRRSRGGVSVGAVSGGNGDTGAASGRTGRSSCFAAQLTVPDDELQKRRQVLYCGPSNRSVDVVAEYLQAKLGQHKCPKIVRVFSEQMEQRKFPVPGESAHMCRSGHDADPAPMMEAIALHNFIRDPILNTRSADTLRSFDELFRLFLKVEEFRTQEAWRRCLQKVASADSQFCRLLEQLALDVMRRRRNLADGEVITYLDLSLMFLTNFYKRLVTAAKKRVLQAFEVVLCTTSVSCSGVLQAACKFSQIIIDEAGMCTEPETLVPLVGFLSTTEDSSKPASHYAERLVLIGDHKQLSPIIQNRTAEQLGLGTSLFERHSHRAIMLSLQYRMHPSLAEFSADFFYRTSSAHLQTRESQTWTGLQRAEDIDRDTERGIGTPWNGINTHRMARKHVFDSYNYRTGGPVRGKLRMENANVLVGCWPGTRKSEDFDSYSARVYSSDRRVAPRDLHPMGEENRIVFLHVEGVEEKVTVTTDEGSEDSRRNLAEIEQVVRVYDAMRKKAERPRIFSESLAVLSQYRYQVSSIAEKIKETVGVRSPIVKTVVASQGSEYDYVILSLVRSLPDFEIPKTPLPSWEAKYLGFITDANQINVALTRARKGLVIIGNQKLLQANHMWSSLLGHLNRWRCIVSNPSSFPDSTGDRRFATRDGRNPKPDAPPPQAAMRPRPNGYNAWQGANQSAGRQFRQASASQQQQQQQPDHQWQMHQPQQRRRQQQQQQRQEFVAAPGDFPDLQ